MVDSEALQAQYGAVPGFVERLMRRTLDALPAQTAQLRAAVDLQDANALAYQAHVASGLAANLLLQPLREQATEAEHIARSEDLDRALKLGQELVEALEQLEAALAQHFGLAP
jgi:HPt (histidine-containing phosphotransfer) domain-containing protein